MKIKTEYIHPPIPIRKFDWVAWVEDKEEEGPYGYGLTEKEAIEDLHGYVEEDPTIFPPWKL